MAKPRREEETSAAHSAQKRLGSLTNSLRAGVLGANDGIISTAGLVVGVVGATPDRGALMVAGIAGALAGALSMAAGEYISVSTQRDTERAALAREHLELTQDPAGELEELARMYRDRGLSPELAHRVAVELTEHDALAAHAEVELGLTPYRVNPWQAAGVSMAAFTLGSLVPLAAMLLGPDSWRLAATVGSVLIATGALGAVSARMGGAPPLRAAARCVLSGVFAMAVTYAVGTLLGTFAPV
ncbi:VIT1/CCC1 transporter family protein [Nocardiopsis algeriensis]|uniref:VIT1/CCC1 family predicted Fe2+/Mn2+ transporter n=1 Tax=Nocardiopsis algeriensis TaxID=1478215 RepID=A0A841J0B4_9ACTN|nr:VIT family protein [Nocardiopsis algeriensis]MBB6121938.1 VIT1/CCC1 family predicted Fe2+/Mn2+ transporter [Nocardiopsis algeriensis]